MWQDRAACRTTDPDLFFPASENTATVRAVKAICLACPVYDRCLTTAMENGHHGIWAATTTAVRSRMARRGKATRLPPARTTAGAEERRDRYAELRRGGFSIQAAALDLGVVYETACRYERDLRKQSQQREGQPA